jgi:hypothetical protein
MRSTILSLLACLVGAGLAAGGSAGNVLILDNELLIEGDIRQEGDHYVVRRGMGETIIPAGKVIELVVDRKQAYRVMSDRCNRHDYDDRVRLVSWCARNDLRDEALAEAELLLKFRPADEKVQRLVDGLRVVKAAPAPVPPAPAAALADKVIQVESPEYNRESFGMFVANVQPILMNVCVGCHTAGKGGDFTLTSVIGGSTPKATFFNLTSTLKQLKRADLANSPLLVKAVAAHGQSVHPPLRDQQAPAYQNLEAWVRMAVVEEPAQQQAPVTTAKPDVVGEAKPAVSTSFGETSVKRDVAADVKPAPKMVFGETSKSQARPEPQTEPKDPFDPAIFNGTIQPKK